MSSQENTNVVRKLYELYNKNDASALSAFDQVCAPNVQLHDPVAPKLKAGIQGLKEAETTYAKAFPNKTTKVDAIFAADDRVVVRWTTTGTHKGTFRGIAGTQRDFKVSGISIYQVANGKVTEIWQVWDSLGLLEQIGELQLAQSLS